MTLACLRVSLMMIVVIFSGRPLNKAFLPSKPQGGVKQLPCGTSAFQMRQVR